MSYDYYKNVQLSIQNTRSTVRRTCETHLKFYKNNGGPEQESRINASEMKFLREVKGRSLRTHIRCEDVRNILQSQTS